MGVYFLYKVNNNKNAHKFNKLIDENEIYQKLMMGPVSINMENRLYVSTIESMIKEDIDWSKKDIRKHSKKGDVKLSYYEYNCKELKFYYPNANIEELFSLFLEDLTKIFTDIAGKMNKELKFYYGSCAFDPEYYFTIKQIQRITNFGQYLTGYSGRDLELYHKILEIPK